MQDVILVTERDLMEPCGMIHHHTEHASPDRTRATMSGKDHTHQVGPAFHKRRFLKAICKTQALGSPLKNGWQIGWRRGFCYWEDRPHPVAQHALSQFGIHPPQTSGQ